jgi:hypothetical protein
MHGVSARRAEAENFLNSRLMKERKGCAEGPSKC